MKKTTTTKAPKTITRATLAGVDFELGRSAKFDRDFSRVRDILSKPADDITPAERLELLTIYRPAWHDSGKIEDVMSFDSSAHGCQFCRAMQAAAATEPAHICGACYDAAQENRYPDTRNRHGLNMVIMMSLDYTREELAIVTAGAVNRVNSSGDTPNATYARNMLRMAYNTPATHWAYWAKNTGAVTAAVDELGKPANMVLIQSSPIIGVPAKLARHFDYTFTVYPDEATTAAAIEAGAMECNGRKCKDCGFACYMGKWAPGANIAEYLRGVSKARRAELVTRAEAIRAAADARRTA